MTKLTATIVIYNTPDLIWQNTLEHLNRAFVSLQTQTEATLTLYVIDNNPHTAYLPKINAYFEKNPPAFYWHLWANPGNQGYGFANNLVLPVLRSQFHLILNPDIYLAEDALIEMLAFFSVHQECGLITGRLSSPENEWQYSFKKHPTLFDHFLRQLAPDFLKKRFYQRMQAFEGRFYDPAKIHYQIPSIMGSLMCFHTTVFKNLQGFDPKFFLYFEDDDISRRAKHFTALAYVPDLKAVHEHAHQALHSWKHKLYFFRSLLRYFCKWGGLW